MSVLADPLTQALEQMLAELESSRLEVILVPQRRWTNEGGSIRCAISKNCRWYRAWCLAHPSSRQRKNSAPDTLIKRANTVRAIEGLIAGTYRGSIGRS
jgi:hypothetical protein